MRATLPTTMVALILLGSLTSTPELSAQPRLWAVYTSDRYLVGRGFSDHPDAKARQSQAQTDARAMLSRSLRSHITSHFETLRRENADAFSETTEVLNTSTSDIEVSGVHFETSREGKWLHVLAHISYEEARKVHSAIATRWAREASDQ